MHLNYCHYKKSVMETCTLQRLECYISAVHAPCILVDYCLTFKLLILLLKLTTMMEGLLHLRWSFNFSTHANTQTHQFMAKQI